MVKSPQHRARDPDECNADPALKSSNRDKQAPPHLQTAREKLIFGHSDPLSLLLYQGDSESASNFPGTFLLSFGEKKCKENPLGEKKDLR